MGLVENLGLKQIEHSHSFVRAKLLGLGHVGLKVLLQHAFVLCFELSQKMGLDVLDFADFYICHVLLHLLLDVGEASRATDSFVLGEKVLEVGPNSEFDVS